RDRESSPVAAGVPSAFAHAIPSDTAATTEDMRAKMQKRIFILISATTLAISAVAQAGAINPFGYRSGQALNRPGSEHDYEHEHEKKQKYTCPMHTEVITDHPGSCPKCGMTLVPKEENRH